MPASCLLYSPVAINRDFKRRKGLSKSHPINNKIPTKSLKEYFYLCTFSILAFSYFSLSLCPFKELLAARNTYLNSLGLIGSFQKANHVTVLSCLISFHLPENRHKIRSFFFNNTNKDTNS